VNSPLVSVICLCYNHERFVEDAIQSVQGQTYTNVELIIVDDCSTDASVQIIEKILTSLRNAKFKALQVNSGNCRAFNEGLKMASGEFIIDLAADDVLNPDRIEKGIQAFRLTSEETGVNFTDAELINERGIRTGYHSDRFPHESIPQGNVYTEILFRYFINSPTMMIRRSVLEKLHGYDETLAYEDFDFWVRSSRDFNYCYTPEALVKKRILPDSLGKSQHKKGSKQMMSTFRVCEKAFALNRTKEEHLALKKRIRYELAHALHLREFKIAFGYLKMLLKSPRTPATSTTDH
jgi:glycosyltransferase involved in cell wall biosynthesis